MTHPAMTCPACGAANVQANRFCQACGAPQVPAPAPDAAAALLRPVLAGDGWRCPTCGLAFPAGTVFCDRDGTRLGGPIAGFASAAAGDASQAGAVRGSGRGGLIARLGVLAMLFVLGGAGAVAYQEGWLDRYVDGWSDPALDILPAPDTASAVDVADTAMATEEAVEATEVAADPQPSAVPVPWMEGRYFARIADQAITLAITNARPGPYGLTSGEITYRNARNGGVCTAMIVPTQDGPHGGNDDAADFLQQPVPGKPGCASAIPISIDPTKGPQDPSGVAGSIDVQWYSPEDGHILMSGTMMRVVGAQ